MNNLKEYYSGNFMGTMKHETLGKIDYFDKANNLSCSLKFGSAKKRLEIFITC